MLPFETIAALFPRVHCMDKGGAVSFRPVTLAHLTAMEAMGVDLDELVNGRNALVAAWILTFDPREATNIVCCDGSSVRAFSRWVRRMRFRSLIRGHDIDPCEIAKRVNSHLAAAFSTIVEGAKEGGTQNLMRTGMGWVLELAEWYAHEYAQTIDDALLVPVARLFALVACARQRNGGKHGAPDYFERIEIKSAKIFLEKMNDNTLHDG